VDANFDAEEGGAGAGSAGRAATSLWMGTASSFWTGPAATVGIAVCACGAFAPLSRGGPAAFAVGATVGLSRNAADDGASFGARAAPRGGSMEGGVAADSAFGGILSVAGAAACGSLGAVAAAGFSILFSGGSIVSAVCDGLAAANATSRAGGSLGADDGGTVMSGAAGPADGGDAGALGGGGSSSFSDEAAAVACAAASGTGAAEIVTGGVSGLYDQITA